MLRLSPLFVAAPLFFIFCSPSVSGNNTAEGPATDTLPPVETKNANTSYRPAFAGQTRAPGIRTTTPYEGRVLTTALRRPWAIVQMPDGRFLVNEKEGNMRIVAADGTIGQPISGIPAVNAAGQGGLLGVTLDPDFETNRMVYWVFSENTQGGNLTSVAKGALSQDGRSMNNVAVIYRATPAYGGNLHYGGRVLVDRSGNLVVGTGERSDLQTRPQAQDLNSGLGKIVRITKDGQPAQGNPFAGQGDARPEMYSYGHRNVQSLAFHPETGDLWEAEFGPRGGDELNRVEPGKNYGWPVITYGIEYGGGKVGQGITQMQGMEQPVYYWDPVLSPSGMTFYTGDAIPEWKNSLFIAGLNSQHIARLVLRDNRVAGEERILASEGERFRDITQGRDGALYAVTDGGKMYQIRKKQ